MISHLINTGADLGFIKGGGGGGVTQGTNLLVEVKHAETRGVWGIPPGNFWNTDAKILQFGDIST